MSEASNNLEDKILNHFFRNTAQTPPVTVYVALYTVLPTDAGGGTEVSTSGTAYGRVAVTFGAPSGGAIANSGALTFTQATADWGTVVGFGIFDASSAGNLMVYSPLDASKAIQNGDTASFAIGALVINCD